jgi:hypothetical protein
MEGIEEQRRKERKKIRMKESEKEGKRIEEEKNTKDGEVFASHSFYHGKYEVPTKATIS